MNNTAWVIATAVFVVIACGTGALAGSILFRAAVRPSEQKRHNERIKP